MADFSMCKKSCGNETMSHMLPAKHHDAIWNMSDILLFCAHTTFSAVRTLVGFFYENSFVIFISLIIAIVLCVCYKCYWSPVLYVKELTDVGFENIPCDKHRLARITRAQQARKLGHKIPPPYPNGWFAVAESRELKIRGVLAVDALGQNLCVFRGEDGIARCVDAYCPHLGANLAVGGAVIGNCIQCPFHKWTFGPNGVCASVPGLEQAPRGVSIKTWHTTEADGVVWIWHDAAGGEPKWSMEYSPGDWTYRGRNEFVISAHVQEVPENGADWTHFHAIHKSSVVTRLAEKYPFLVNIIGNHVWASIWNKSETHSHIAEISITHTYEIMKFNLFQVNFSVQQIGPAYARIHVKTAVGPILVVISVTPLGPLLQKVVHRVYSPTHSAPLSILVVYFEAFMFERDVTVWNNMMFMGAPAYAKTDKPIRVFRSWYSQFYSEDSKSFKDAVQNSLDW